MYSLLIELQAPRTCLKPREPTLSNFVPSSREIWVACLLPPNINNWLCHTTEQEWTASELESVWKQDISDCFSDESIKITGFIPPYGCPFSTMTAACSEILVEVEVVVVVVVVVFVALVLVDMILVEEEVVSVVVVVVVVGVTYCESLHCHCLIQPLSTQSK